jgi:hypothetical protein
VEVLGSDPELLAIADAIAATGPPARRTRVPSRLLLASAAVVVAAIVALVAPWSESRGGVLQQALAAVNGTSVLHVVLVSNVPGTTIVDLKSGRPSPTTLRVETWFDAKRLLKRTNVTGFGQRTEVVETPHGAWSRLGPVATCAWIAAHPVRATKLRVSCNASGRNGTTPHRIAVTPPSADPALDAFVTGYRAALRKGTARNLGPGTAAGRRVYWIGFRLGTEEERVAVDRRTYRPLVYEVFHGRQVVTRARVASIGSVAYTPQLFARPTIDRPTPSAGEVARTRHVSLAVATRALGAHARSLGARFGSLPLVESRIDELTTGYGPLVKHARTRAPGVELVYGDSGGFIAGTAFLRVSEALSPQIAYGMVRGGVPPAGSLILTRVENLIRTPSAGTSARRALWFGELRSGPLYVAIQGSSRALVIGASRALSRPS